MIEEKIYPIPIIGTTALIYHFKSGNRRYDTSMEVITKREYELIRERNLNYNSPKYGIITHDNMMFVGKLNFENESLIKNAINSWKIINDDKGFPIYSNFDFETATIKTENGKLMWYDTWNNVKVIKYKYCQIGKPNYVIIFKTMVR